MRPEEEVVCKRRIGTSGCLYSAITWKSSPSHEAPSALAELVWNSFDADASSVDVVFVNDSLGALSEIRVRDDGHGFLADEAVEFFGSLGGSWKAARRRSRNESRLLHGHAGKGRFKAYALASHVTWETVAKHNGEMVACKVIGSGQDISSFTISSFEPVQGSEIGTVVILGDLRRPFPTLEDDDALQRITEEFAPYLIEYPKIVLSYDGSAVDPDAAITHRDNLILGEIDLDGVVVSDAEMTVIEWKRQTERSMFLCDENGFTLARTSPGVHAPGFQFTSYLKSSYLRELDNAGLLSLAEMHKGLGTVLDTAKASLRDYFRRRASESTSDLVAAWKEQGIYPYEGEPKNPIENAERQVFNICAASVSEYLPEFEEGERRSRKLTLRLLRQALEDSPDALRKILGEVVDLPQAKQEELAGLLERTSLSAIIEAASDVASRLDFMKGLEILVYNPESRDVLLERRQLHKILEQHTWVFGEEFNLSVSDQSLDEVLRAHIEHLGREDLGECAVEPVDIEGRSRGIIDLMLSRRVPQPRGDQREHLVVELKRPKVKLGQRELSQIKTYAFAVAGDERFKDTKTRWVFWLVSNEVEDSVLREATQQNRPPGQVYIDQEENMQIWVKTWGQLLQECEGRLTFFQERLEYAVSQESGLEFLRKSHKANLPEALKGNGLEEVLSR